MLKRELVDFCFGSLTFILFSSLSLVIFDIFISNGDEVGVVSVLSLVFGVFLTINYVLYEYYYDSSTFIIC